ncbi:Shikimate kinase/Threonine synthase-like 1 [Syntrophomonas zehnderi OL-4]|uniref:Shikimate kinase n=1 Tax=Syntrophomonas zehnderi OL-4 TaxID=690567 RepID=A0A0E4GAI0_9FIRM|nr:shikimate kinase [Syntrophomonas zehnderi]CFX48577.1 Shikimate kinase/Threonine synthase-like 1 [Syntrophomonas zehnderi OL-4]
MKKNIVLIGFMGTGKSSVGSKLAMKLNKEFVDMDREIENISGMTVTEIFRRFGELRFRSEESLMAKKLSLRDNLVIATGGGTVLLPENIEVLRQNGIIILLEATAQDIHTRVSRKKGTRPLLKGSYTAEDIQHLLDERKPYYDCADIRVNTSSKDLDAVIEEIINELNQYETLS